jgi:branched-chain amino acid transport system ATP-binding protein
MARDILVIRIMVAMLETHQLVKRFGGLVALNGIDLRVDPGEIVSVVGPNGSGKTTLFNTISGVYQPDAGSVLLEAHDITGSRPNEIADRGIARTFQTIRLFNNPSVLDKRPHRQPSIPSDVCV